MHRSPGLLALGLFFVASGIGFLMWSLRPQPPLPPTAKKRELREQTELATENVKLRIAGAAAIAFGALIALIS